MVWYYLAVIGTFFTEKYNLLCLWTDNLMSHMSITRIMGMVKNWLVVCGLHENARHILIPKEMAPRVIAMYIPI